jgi:hypothetical protein
MLRLKELPRKPQERIVMLLKVKMVFLLSALCCTVGCAVAEIPSQNRAVQAENRQVYEIYQQYMQSMNEQRAMSGIPPQPVKPYEEWQKSPGTD